MLIITAKSKMQLQIKLFQGCMVLGKVTPLQPVISLSKLNKDQVPKQIQLAYT